MGDLYLSYNIAGSSNLAGLRQLILMFKPIIIFLQEVTLTSEQLIAVVGNDYSAISNIDNEESCKPGTATLWKSQIEAVVVNIVPLRIQLLT